MNNKKGVSGVVTTLLLIVISIAAVAVLWYALKPGISSSGEDVNALCLKLDLEPLSCKLSGVGNTNASVVMQRNAGEGAVKRVKVIFENSAGEKKIVDSAVGEGEFNILDTKTVSNVNVTGFAPVKVKVAGEFEDSKGDKETCPESVKSVACTA